MTILRNFSSGEVSPFLVGRVDSERWHSSLGECRNFIPMPEGGLMARQGFQLCANLGVVSKPRFVPFEFSGTDSYVMLFDGSTVKVIEEGNLVNYTGYCAIDETTLRWAQSGDTLFLTDGSTAPRKIVRGSTSPRESNWTVSDTPFRPTVPTFSNWNISGGTASTYETTRYRITGVDSDGNETSIYRGPFRFGLNANAAPWVITAPAHGLQSYDEIELQSDVYIGGVKTYKAGQIFRVVKQTDDTFIIPGTTTTAYTGGYIGYRPLQLSARISTPTSTATATVAWAPDSNAYSYYNVFRQSGKLYGYIGSTSETSYTDKGTTPDTKDNPVVGIDPTEGDDFPAAVGIVQQRLVFGGFQSNVERVVASSTGNYTSFDPGTENDSGLDFDLGGRSVSNIQHLLEINGRAVVMSGTTEWALLGSSDAGLTPSAINARADSFNGCSSATPALAGTNIIYIHRSEKILFDASYSSTTESLASTDLTLWARHLFNKKITRVVIQKSERMIWVLREDGILLGATYIPEQQIVGWHRHDISGRTFEDICVVAEDNVDRLYVLSKDSTNEYHVLRLPERWYSGDVRDWKGFDEWLEYDGRDDLGSFTVSLSGGGWTTRDSITVTAIGANPFESSHVGKVMHVELNGASVQITLTATISGNAMSATPRSIIPESLREIQCSYAICANTVTGAAHLSGETVGVIADGSREADTVVASDGSITLSRYFARIHVGIPVTSSATTLPIEAAGKDSMMGNKRQLTKVILNLNESRGVKVGSDESTLEVMSNEYDSLLNASPKLQTGVNEVNMVSVHSDTGSILIRQDSGLPTHVLECRLIFNTGETR